MHDVEQDPQSEHTEYALRASDGSLTWFYAIDGQVFNQPILQDATLYVGAANGML
ncbi:MAG: hypothetical protein IMW89_10855, partial [Ktedonobacteraceae bacterium]|nr:hypothetical protein [Ktedonobacteraceae bacterium]